MITLDPNALRCVVSQDGRSATITVLTPTYILKPERITGVKMKGAQHIVKQKIYESLQLRTKSESGLVDHDIVLNLPFEVEPSTSSDLFRDKTVKGQVTCCNFVGTDHSNIQPNETVSTYVLVFKKRTNGFAIDSKVTCKGVLNLSSDDEDGDGNWAFGRRS